MQFEGKLWLLHHILRGIVFTIDVSGYSVWF